MIYITSRFFQALFSFVILIHVFYGKGAASVPTLFVKNENEERIYTLSHYCLLKHSIFELFDKSFLYSHYLPKDTISYRNNSHEKVDSRFLQDLLEDFIASLLKEKKDKSNFIILKDTNFNHKKKCGSLIVGFKEYPFIAKIFIESSRSFIKPLSKGIESYLFFLVGGGLSRHLVGFTRIKNLVEIKESISHSSYWESLLAFPRKWFFVPQCNTMIQITGAHFTPGALYYTEVPSIYCIVEDKINIAHYLSFFNTKECAFIVALCNYLKMRIDPNPFNFVYEKETGKIAVIDSENFNILYNLPSHLPYFKSCLGMWTYIVTHTIRKVIKGLFQTY